MYGRTKPAHKLAAWGFSTDHMYSETLVGTLPRYLVPPGPKKSNRAPTSSYLGTYGIVKVQATCRKYRDAYDTN
jgi:hypothetical protein